MYKWGNKNELEMTGTGCVCSYEAAVLEENETCLLIIEEAFKHTVEIRSCTAVNEVF